MRLSGKGGGQQPEGVAPHRNRAEPLPVGRSGEKENKEDAVPPWMTGAAEDVTARGYVPEGMGRLAAAGA